MDEHRLTAARDAATAYAREHARELATELLEWSDTTLLRDGRVRELARMLQVLDAAHALKLARSFAERAALELAARCTTPDRECEWKCDDVDNGTWESCCGEIWTFTDGGPVENGMLFCHRCGSKLKTAPNGEKV
ncbi:hypothetical protein [Burkholderia cenocepacia]|uniref:hypothetical protein n=1 Tax=Burkholderia cenocepacia TaxID=95486 RepID=UPI002AB7BBB1|nr:hypothetical protein [Burkholderia cenocepacia]